MATNISEKELLLLAIDEAAVGLSEGGIPIGAVLASTKDKIVAKGLCGAACGRITGHPEVT
jgi:tRNA(Arg) A34 adenosine deaminase TadA